MSTMNLSSTHFDAPLVDTQHLEKGQLALVHAKKREGWDPAIIHKELTQAPLFWHGRRASRHSSIRIPYRTDFGTHAQHWVETINPLPITGKRENAGGLLRHLDQDILVALSHQWTVTGSPHVTYEQKLILAWMGYTHIDSPPFRELKGSVRRMADTKIAFGSDQQKDIYDTRSFHLLDTPHGGIQKSVGRRHALVDATLSSSYLAALSDNNWQVYDIRLYGHLCRLGRDFSLARTLYLFFSSFRAKDGSFEIPIGWITDRYKDIRWDNKKNEWRADFSDPFHKNSTLGKNFRFLIESGVIAFDKRTILPSHDGNLYRQRISGRFASPSLAQNLPAVEPEQLAIFSYDKLTGNFVDLINNDNKIKNEAVIQDLEKVSTRKKKDLSQRTVLNNMCTSITGMPKSWIDRALKGGWTDSELFFFLAITVDLKKDNLVGWIKSLLFDKMNDSESRAEYSKEHLVQKMGAVNFFFWLEDAKKRFYPSDIYKKNTLNSPYKHAVIDLIRLTAPGKSYMNEMFHADNAMEAMVRVRREVSTGHLDRITPEKMNDPGAESTVIDIITRAQNSMILILKGYGIVDVDVYMSNNWPGYTPREPT